MKAQKRIGILGAGSIGSTLTRRLSEAGHDVKVANSRGPETIDSSLCEYGARRVEAEVVAVDVDVLVTSIPFNMMPGIVSLVAALPPEVVIIDTSNYYPHRDGNIPAVDSGQAEGEWVSEILGRPVVKAWNAITSQSFAAKATPSGAQGRIAIPVAGDKATGRDIAMGLVEDTGFDAFDAGALADSWRQQPASPVYCTDLTLREIPAALAAADKVSIPKLRDLGMELLIEKTHKFASIGDRFGDWLVEFNRLVYRPVP
ncbi:NADPH-dependent F420 reductase [Rhodococcus qingshengii]|uniref:NADPH-dependent F420 reductase n=1 Tax=Rhodococcus qingshengii TaxID=334542 RepID=UPI0010A67D53|nr:NAD(P)-binding domain-containing protein [Rhodococcus qingshengii]THJ64717.1 NADP oxidoreductase [Rhodococcus qingshengii]